MSGDPDAGRRSHYADFYAEAGARFSGDPDAGPRVLVLGNCQAESVRLLLGDDVRTVRVPPLFEITAAEVDRLRSLVREADALVTQPVGDAYRGLPLGTRELLAARSNPLPLVRFPPLRFAGMHPWHVVVHPPHLVDPDPPVVAYHDLRTAVRAVWEDQGRSAPEPPALTVAAVRAVSRDSLAQLREREKLHDTLPVADLFAPPANPQMRTVNHAGNPVFEGVAGRVRDALGLPARVVRADQELLDAVRAPVDDVVGEVFPGTPTRQDWWVDGVCVSEEEVARRQLQWYRHRPDILAEVVRRTGMLRQHLGLRLPDEDRPSRSVSPLAR